MARVDRPSWCRLNEPLLVLPAAPVKHTASVRLYQPGIVLFDPAVLHGFIATHLPGSTAPFQAFIDDPSVGDAAVRSGAVFPMYPVEEDDYAVFVQNGGAPAGATAHFQYTGAPLQVQSGLLVVADLSALLSWERDFFLGYRQHRDDRLPNNDALDVAPGLYCMAVHGYTGLPAPLPARGYGLVLQPVAHLPADLPDSEFDFALPLG